MGISTHVLDTGLGLPVVNLPVELFWESSDGWVSLLRASTDANGRIKNLLPDYVPVAAGMYRIRFTTEAHYKAQGIAGLYPYVEITFLVSDVGRHWHIPLLLTANGYTTYRGS